MERPYNLSYFFIKGDSNTKAELRRVIIFVK